MNTDALELELSLDGRWREFRCEDVGHKPGAGSACAIQDGARAKADPDVGGGAALGTRANGGTELPGVGVAFEGHAQTVGVDLVEHGSPPEKAQTNEQNDDVDDEGGSDEEELFDGHEG